MIVLSIPAFRLLMALLYQSIIGSLLYIQIGTRPDISFAVSHLAQYASNPSSQHMRLAKYILAYLVGTVDAKLV